MNSEQRIAVGLAVLGSLRSVLGARLLALVAMAASVGLFAYCVAFPDWGRFASACAFAALVYLPAMLRARRGGSE